MQGWRHPALSAGGTKERRGGRLSVMIFTRVRGFAHRIPRVTTIPNLSATFARFASEFRPFLSAGATTPSFVVRSGHRAREHASPFAPVPGWRSRARAGRARGFRRQLARPVALLDRDRRIRPRAEIRSLPALASRRCCRVERCVDASWTARRSPDSRTGARTNCVPLLGTLRASRERRSRVARRATPRLPRDLGLFFARGGTARDAL